MNTFYTILTTFLLSYCTICQSEHSKTPSNSNRSDTYLPTHEINHIWAIHQFRFHENLEADKIYSPYLHAPTTDRYEWNMKIYPNGQDNNNDTISVYVCISNHSAVEEATAEANISIINNKKEVLLHEYLIPKKYARRAGVLNTQYWRCWGRKNFCKKDDYFRNHLLQNDTLTFSVHIKWVSESPNEDIQRNVSSTTATPETTSVKYNLTENLESMLENPKFANVVFITNGNSYPAHKNILAARSSIFDAMFQRKDSKNAKSKKIRINVTPMNEKVLRAMLRYIYTGQCEPSSLGKLTDRLFEAATKYGVYGLKETCEQTHNKTILQIG
ncbi:speckle-type POZ protein-like isoform X2 [Planococcus citri]|uniref:speckle-type POZ protein-like isoform X2 n=1 Tax=Planococcus citri TaxID=170843 RepID=UPI0031F8795D